MTITPTPVIEVATPLVTCIMPTAGRASFVGRSIELFLAQDYPYKELVIVYNTDRDIPSGPLPYNVTAVRTFTKIIGGKRNEACRHARGTIIAHWDDDDMYGAGRLTAQAGPIVSGTADITGLRNMAFYEAHKRVAWLPSVSLFDNIFVANVHGGSLVYDLRLWKYVIQYPNINLGEDADFLRRSIKAGARLVEVDGRDHFVYVRHSNNTWTFKKDNFRKYSGWKKIPIPPWAEPLAPYYTKMSLAQKSVNGIPVSVVK